jgi:hypothetical protein
VGVEKLPFSQNSQNLGIENVHPNVESRLYGFLTQSFFDHFPEVEFSNSHSRFHSSTFRDRPLVKGLRAVVAEKAKRAPRRVPVSEISQIYC